MLISRSASLSSTRALVGFVIALAAGLAGCAASIDQGEEGVAASAQAIEPSAPVCNLVITTSKRTIDANQLWRGGAAAHQGYVSEPSLQPLSRCGAAGVIQTMNDGEGFCAYNGEVILSVDRVDCPAPPQDAVCNVIVTTDRRVIDGNAGWLGGAADRGGYTDQVGLVPAAPGSRCVRDGYQNIIRLMNDGEGFCAYNGEVIEDIEIQRCSTPPLHPVCGLTITTDHPRTYNVGAQQPGGAAAHGGYVYDPAIYPTVMDGSHRCTADAGYGSIVRAFADGEGFCAYDHEHIVSVERSLCPLPPPEQICNLVVTTDRRTIDVNALLPGGAASHGGFRTSPSIEASLPRCHNAPAYDYDSMIVLFGDGEGFCAYDGEEILSVYREACSP